MTEIVESSPAAEAAAPVATPTPAPSVETPAFDVASLLGEDDVPDSLPTAPIEKPVEQKPTETKPPETKIETKPAEKPPVETKVETKPVETKPVEAKPVETKPVEQAPVEKPIDVKALRSETLTKLEQSNSLNEEEAELLRTEPEKIIPKLAARIQLQTYEAVTQAILTQLPVYLSQFSHRMSASKEAETKFTSRWPQLADPKFAPEIIQTAELLGKMNPNVTLEQRIEEVGAILAVKHKLFAQEVATKQTAPAPAATLPPVAPVRPGTVLSDTRTGQGPADILEMMQDED